MTGIVADGVTDNTVALQAAINAVMVPGSGFLQLPAGKILISGNIRIDPSNWPFTMVGYGQAVTQIIHNGSFGDAVSLVNCAGGHFANFGISATAKMPAGANLSVNQAYRADFANISLQEGFVNLRVANVTGATFRRIYTGGGTFFPGVVAGSYNLWLAAAPGGVSNGLDFDGCYWEGGQQGQFFYDESIRIDNVDGAWFRGGHIYGATGVQVVVNAGPAVTSVLFDGVYFEHGAVYGMVVLNPTGKVDSITITGCQFNNQTYPLAISGQAPPSCVIMGNRGMKTIPSLPGSVVLGNI